MKRDVDPLAPRIPEPCGSINGSLQAGGETTRLSQVRSVATLGV